MAKKRNYLYEAIALVKWDGNNYTCTGVPYSELSLSQRLEVHSQARFILKVVQTFKELKHGTAEEGLQEWRGCCGGSGRTAPAGGWLGLVPKRRAEGGEVMETAC